MPWDDTTRKQHNRDALRYPSDLTDREWEIVAGMIPPAKPGGRPRSTNMRQVVNHILVAATRELEGREPSPSAGVIDSQSIKTTESGGISGYDAGKKIKGRKRHIITDTLGLMLFVLVHAADIQDRDGAPDVLKAIRCTGSPGCAMSSPTAATQATNSAPH